MNLRAVGKEKIQSEDAKLKPVIENMLKRKKQRWNPPIFKHTIETENSQ